MNLVFLLFGAAFGFLMSRAGATGYDFYAGLFLFRDLQLLWVIAAAVTVGILGLAWLRLRRRRPLSVLSLEPLEFQPRPYRRGLVIGALLFGAGWGLSGSCPGSVLAMIGEGKLLALPTMGGIVLGTYLFGLWEHRRAVPPGPGRTEALASSQ